MQLVGCPGSSGKRDSPAGPQEPGMKRHIVSFAAAAFFALTVSSAWAQPTQDGGSRPAGSGGGSNGTSSAAPASGGGGGGSSVSGESGSTASSSPSVGSAGNSGAWGDTRSAGGAPRASAPMRGPGAAYREDGGRRANPRGSSSGEGRATPRGSSGGDNGDRAARFRAGRGTPADAARRLRSTVAATRTADASARPCPNTAVRAKAGRRSARPSSAREP